jgi:uncharacterized protein YdaT
MPWTAKDAPKHTRKTKSAKSKRQWAHIADSMLKRGESEGAAIRAANGVIRKGSGASGRTGKFTHGKKRKSSR